MRNVLCSGRVTPNARTTPIAACTASNPTTTPTAILSSRPGARFRAASTSPNSASAPVATRVASARASYTPRTLYRRADRLACGGAVVKRGNGADLRAEEPPAEPAERLGVTGREELVRRVGAGGICTIG